MAQITPAEAAEIAGKSKAAVLKWVRDEKLQAEKIETGHGRGYLIDEDDLRKYLAAHAQKPKRKSSPKVDTGKDGKPDDGSAADALLMAKDETIQTLRDQIDELKGQIKTKDDQIERLHTLVAQAQAKVPALPDSKDTGKRSWWPFGERNKR